MKIPICLVGADGLAFDRLRRVLAGEAAYEIEPQMFPYSEAIEHLQIKTGPTIAVIELRRDPEQDYQLVQEIKFRLPHVRLVMLSRERSPETILRAMRAGAEDFLTQPLIGEAVLRVFDAIRQKIGAGVARAAKRGKVIAVASNKGGVGTTTVATNIAANLAGRNKEVCLVDLVLQFGSVTSFLNLDPTYTILDVVETIRRADSPFLEDSLVKHSSGVRVLAEPFRAEDARRITPADIDEILDVLALSFDFVVIDTPKDFDDILTLVLDKADVILFVTEMDIPSLRNARRAFDLFERMCIANGKVRLVLNRYVKNKIMNLETVEETLRMKVFWTLPNNYPVAVTAINQGLSIEEWDFRSDIAKSYSGLAAAMIQPVGLSGRTEIKSAPAARTGLVERWLNASGLLK